MYFLAAVIYLLIPYLIILVTSFQFQILFNLVLEKPFSCNNAVAYLVRVRCYRCFSTRNIGTIYYCHRPLAPAIQKS